MSPNREQPGPARWAWALTAVLLLACLLPLVRIFSALPVCAVLDYNEGWNAFHVDSLLHGEPLYLPIGHAYHNNYPPLAFHPTTLIAPWFGDPMLAGRALALAAFAACCAGVGAVARALGCGWSLVAASAAFTLALFLAYSHYVGINDPQMLGHALAIAGLWLVVRRPRTSLAVAAGATLVAASGFVKHNLIVVPLALLVWLWLFDRPRVRTYVLAGLVAAAALWVVSGLLHGWDFMRHLVAPREYSWAAMLRASALWLAKGALLLAPLAWALWRRPRDPALALCGLWAGIGVLSGCYFIGGWGVDQNVFFDAYFAIAVSLALISQRLSDGEPVLGLPLGTGKAASGAALMIVAGCALMPLAVATSLRAQATWLQADHWLRPYQAESAAQVARSRQVVKVRATGDCGQPGHCYQSRMLLERGHLVCTAP